MTTSTIPFSSIMKEEGVTDLRSLGLKVVAAFAKALYMEREAGHTTPEAEAQLELAIQAEADALAS